MSQCCGKGSVESLIDKFKIVNATFHQKQHPHSAPVLTTQKTNPFSSTNTNVLTRHGFLKYTRPTDNKTSINQ